MKSFEYSFQPVILMIPTENKQSNRKDTLIKFMQQLKLKLRFSQLTTVRTVNQDPYIRSISHKQRRSAFFTTGSCDVRQP